MDTAFSGTVLSHRFEQAFAYANSIHGAQRRKIRNDPYVGHLLGVAAIVLEYGGTEDEAIAALLHDSVEDQGGAARLADVRARFGPAVAEIVAACSDCMEAGDGPKPPWRARKEQYIAHARETKNTSIRLVSASDKLHNARAILADFRERKDAVWKSFTGGKEQTLWYYRSLADIFLVPPPCPVGPALHAVVAELEAAAR